MLLKFRKKEEHESTMQHRMWEIKKYDDTRSEKKWTMV